MSNALFHASFAFAFSSPFIYVCGMSGQLAFVPAIISMLMDLDASISPSSRFERSFHSPYALLVAVSLPLLSSFIGVDVFIAALPSIAFVAHIIQDIISGEIELDIDALRCRGEVLFVPKVARVMDLASIPAALIAILV